MRRDWKMLKMLPKTKQKDGESKHLRTERFNLYMNDSDISSMPSNEPSELLLMWSIVVAYQMTCWAVEDCKERQEGKESRNDNLVFFFFSFFFSCRRNGSGRQDGWKSIFLDIVRMSRPAAKSAPRVARVFRSRVNR